MVKAIVNSNVAPDEELPKGRDWAKEVRVGVYAILSMKIIHNHAISKDLVST